VLEKLVDAVSTDLHRRLKDPGVKEEGVRVMHDLARLGQLDVVHRVYLAEGKPQAEDVARRISELEARLFGWVDQGTDACTISAETNAVARRDNHGESGMV
jgi:hypothetical protein